MFFDLATGKQESATENSSVHYADGLLHFWCENIMYSIPYTKNVLNYFEENVGGDNTQVLFWIDSGISRFMFSTDKKFVPALKEFLVNAHEQEHRSEKSS